MLAEPECVACILSKQEKRCQSENKDERFAFLKDVLNILLEYGSEESSPQLCERIDRIYERYFEPENLTELKSKYNSLLLNREEKIRQSIQNTADSIALAVKYACIGNYIDFHAVDVEEEYLDDLLNSVENKEIDGSELKEFKEELERAHTLLYLTDNCGEIVLDKLLMDTLKQNYPNLDITVMVRGEPVSNDATLEDAQQAGLTEKYMCITNDCASPGVVPDKLGDDLKELLNASDIIISKGQGNFEGMYGSGLNTYYMFLCKCELFTKRFDADRFTPIFAKESRLKF